MARVRSYWPWTLTFGLVVLAGTALAVRRGRTGSRGHGAAVGSPLAAQRRGGVELAGVPGRVVVRAAPPREGVEAVAAARCGGCGSGGCRCASWARGSRGSGRGACGPRSRTSPCASAAPAPASPARSRAGSSTRPGAAIATSTRTDLYRLTAPLRERVGPVYVFNPGGLADLPSTITFDPLAGCEHADDRAGPRVRPAVRWPGQRRVQLRAGVLDHPGPLRAGRVDARRGDRASAGCRRCWTGWPTPRSHADLILRLLRRSTVPTFEAAARQFLETNDRTQSSITTTIMPALGWLQNQTAAAAAHATRTRPARDGWRGRRSVTTVIRSRARSTSSGCWPSGARSTCWARRTRRPRRW